MPGYLEGAERAAIMGAEDRAREDAQSRLLHEKILAEGGLSPEDTLRALKDYNEANPGLLQKGVENIPRLWHRAPRRQAAAVPNPTLQTRGPQATAPPPPSDTGQPWEPRYQRARQDLESLTPDMTTPGERKLDTALEMFGIKERAGQQAEARKNADALNLARFRDELAANAKNATLEQRVGFANRFLKENPKLDPQTRREILLAANGIKIPAPRAVPLSEKLSSAFTDAAAGDATPQDRRLIAGWKRQQEFKNQLTEQGNDQRERDLGRALWGREAGLPGASAWTALQLLPRIDAEGRLLGNSNLGPLNKLTQAAARQTGDINITAFLTNRDDLVKSLSELARYVPDSEQVVSQVSQARTYGQLHAALTQLKFFLQTYIQGLQKYGNSIGSGSPFPGVSASASAPAPRKASGAPNILDNF